MLITTPVTTAAAAAAAATQVSGFRRREVRVSRVSSPGRNQPAQAGDEPWGGSAGLRGPSRFRLGRLALPGGHGRFRHRVRGLRQDGGLGFPGPRAGLGLTK